MDTKAHEWPEPPFPPLAPVGRSGLEQEITEATEIEPAVFPVFLLSPVSNAFVVFPTLATLRGQVGHRRQDAQKAQAPGQPSGRGRLIPPRIPRAVSFREFMSLVRSVALLFTVTAFRLTSSLRLGAGLRHEA